MDPLEAKIAASLAEGRPVAHACISEGPGLGRRMLVWSAGEVFGGMGSPRLNQRIAQYAEAQFGKGWKGSSSKRFQHNGESYEVAFTVLEP